MAVAVDEVLALPEACFAWPADLPAPRVVLLLVMPHDADRMARLRARGAAEWGPTEVRPYLFYLFYFILFLIYLIYIYL